MKLWVAVRAGGCSSGCVGSVGILGSVGGSVVGTVGWGSGSVGTAGEVVAGGVDAPVVGVGADVHPVAMPSRMAAASSRHISLYL